MSCCPHNGPVLPRARSSVGSFVRSRNVSHRSRPIAAFTTTETDARTTADTLFASQSVTSERLHNLFLSSAGITGSLVLVEQTNSPKRVSVNKGSPSCKRHASQTTTAKDDQGSTVNQVVKSNHDSGLLGHLLTSPNLVPALVEGRKHPEPLIPYPAHHVQASDCSPQPHELPLKVESVVYLTATSPVPLQSIGPISRSFHDSAASKTPGREEGGLHEAGPKGSSEVTPMDLSTNKNSRTSLGTPSQPRRTMSQAATSSQSPANRLLPSNMSAHLVLSMPS